MDIVLPNFYDTTGKSYSQFGMNVGVVNLLFQCDVYITSLDEFVSWFNSYSPRYKMEK
jgi:hypothetical protein